MSRIFGLDFVRAFAISLVLFGHVHLKFQEVGIYGVELFFALSGFLIGSILYRYVPEGERWSLGEVKNFWQRRWWRTLPAYYLFLLVAVVHHSFRGELPEGGLLGVLPYLLFLPNLMSPNEVFYSISWSLCVEEAFYLLFPLLLFGAYRLTRSRIPSFVIALSILLVGCAILREVSFALYPAAQVRVITLPRIDAIACGVIMALVMQCYSFSDRLCRWLALLGGAIISLVLVFHWQSKPIDEAESFFRFALIAMPLGFTLIMPYFARWKEASGVLARFRKPITKISLWSYSIYLCHHMVLMTIYPLFGEAREAPFVKALSKVVGFAVILVISRFIYTYYEAPMTKRRPPERSWKKRLGETGSEASVEGAGPLGEIEASKEETTLRSVSTP